MLEHTFCHIPGIGPKTERHLWRAGLHSWHAAAREPKLPLSASKADSVRRDSAESIVRLDAGDAPFFYRRLPSGEQWRLFPDFRRRIAYLDIETTGLGGPEAIITTITVYDGDRLHHYVHGENLLDFRDDIWAYDVLVTYNGKQFDLPFIRRVLGVPVRQPHIDLRYVLASLGYRGGLKGCERQFGLDRDDLADVDGYFAVLLWHHYQRTGNPRALNTLLAYNTLDAINLEALLVAAYNLKVAPTPFADARRLPAPELPPLPFQPDLETIERIRWHRAGMQE
jgi:hypothetical protein